VTASDESPDLFYAGFWIRVWASIIDSVLVMIVVLPLLRMIYGSAVLELDGPLILGPAHVLISYILPAMAIIIFWAYHEATPGKIAIGARIVDARSGGHPRTSQFVIRYLGYFAASLPLGIGLLWVGIDRRKQGWHDKIANTVVVRERAGAVPVSFEHSDRHSPSSDDGRWQA
jgi:uncharacterized RDD family membrane protein YckC